MITHDEKSQQFVFKIPKYYFMRLHKKIYSMILIVNYILEKYIEKYILYN